MLRLFFVHGALCEDLWRFLCMWIRSPWVSQCTSGLNKLRNLRAKLSRDPLHFSCFCSKAIWNHSHLAWKSHEPFVALGLDSECGVWRDTQGAAHGCVVFFNQSLALVCFTEATTTGLLQSISYTCGTTGHGVWLLQVKELRHFLLLRTKKAPVNSADDYLGQILSWHKAIYLP